MACGREAASGSVEVEECVGSVGRRREEEAASEELRVEGERRWNVEPRGGRGCCCGEKRREGEAIGEERVVGAEECNEEGEQGGEGDARSEGAECGVEGEERKRRGQVAK